MSYSENQHLLTLKQMSTNKQLQVQYLLQIQDNHGNRTVHLEPTHHSIGRGLNNSILLHSSQVSRQHAMLLRVTNQNHASYSFRLIDGDLHGKSSTNGVFINGQRCSSHDLQHGDQIKFSRDCIATYYDISQLSSFKEITPKTQISSSIHSHFYNSFPTQIDANIKPESLLASALTRLASFPEIVSNPIVEMTLGGTITYINLVAVEQFPDILELRAQHVILAGLVSAFEPEQDKIFVRQVEYGSRIYKQSVCYNTETRLLRTYFIDLTQQKQQELAEQQIQDEIIMMSEQHIQELKEYNAQLQTKLDESLNKALILREENEMFKSKIQDLTANLQERNYSLLIEKLRRQQMEENINWQNHPTSMTLIKKIVGRLNAFVNSGED